MSEIMDFEKTIFLSGAGLSIMCTIALFITWCLLPRWRTLQNYISLNQITNGTLHMCSATATTLNPFNDFDGFDYIKIFVILNGYLFVTTICWLLCSSLIAYLRLVTVYTRKISYEKRKATAFTYLTVAVIKGIGDGIVPNILTLDIDQELCIHFLLLFFVMTIILLLFTRIVISVLSCCKKKISDRNIGHVLYLIGVAILCDSALVAQVIILIYFSGNLM